MRRVCSEEIFFLRDRRGEKRGGRGDGPIANLVLGGPLNRTAYENKFISACGPVRRFAYKN